MAKSKSKTETGKEKTVTTKAKASPSNSRKKAATNKAETSSASAKRSKPTKAKTSITEPTVDVVEDVWSLGNKSKFNTSNEPASQKRSKQKKTITKATTQKSVSSSRRRKNVGKTGKEDTGKHDVTEAELVTNGDFDVLGDYDDNGNATDFTNATNIRDTSVPAVPLKTAINKSSDPKLEFSDLGQVLSELPEDVVDNMPTIQNRINAYLTYFSAMSLKRLPRLFRFIDAAEEILFNPDDLLHLDFDQINNVYRNAKATANDTLENARKVTQTVQTDNDKKVDALYNMLTAMSPDTVARMLEMANIAEQEHKAAKEEEEKALKERQFESSYTKDYSTHDDGDDGNGTP